MSRSYCTYDEEWQRRKSVLIRSLFHDIPILSPVEEESNGSSHDYYVPSQDVFPSPSRPYSPLPPLIIERIPSTNKHDEPEEYYRKLHEKIKKIYEKLFLEKRNVSSVDFDSNYNDGSVNDEGENNTEGSVENLVYESGNNSPQNGNFESVIEDREARESSASTNSNGYGADFESMDTADIDVVNRTATVSNEDIIMLSEEEESENANTDENRIRYEEFDNCRASENKAFSAERMDYGAFSENEKSHRSTVTDQGTTENEESDETEIVQNYEAKDSDGEIKAVQNTNNQKSNREEFERTGFEGRNELIASINEPMEADVETSQSSEGPYYRQITTEALVHFDGYLLPGERESIVYEDSVKSIILPTRFRRLLASCNVDVDDRIEVYTELEENGDPKITATFDFDENATAEEDLEEVATSHQDTTLENDEEMSAHQPDAIVEDDEEMSAPQSNASNRNFEEIGTRQPGAMEDDAEEMSGRHSDYSKEVDTNHPGATFQVIEERRNLDSDDTEEENEVWHQTNYAEEDVGVMRTPGLDTIDEDNEEMSSHQAEEHVEVDIEETETPSPDASDKKTEEISFHQPVADEQNEANRVSRQDEYEIVEMSLTQRDHKIDATFKKDTAHPNTMDEEMKTEDPGTNEEEIRPSQTEVTGEDIEKTRTPRSKADKKQMRTKVPESTQELKINQPAATEDVEEMESPHSIELMRTPRPVLSHGTIPITQRSDSASTNEHTALPQELTVLTSSIQDGAADNNMSELQSSHDMNEILTSIFNESQNKNRTPVSGTKRKLVDKSVQAIETNKLTWEEMRTNFFVGTPKIFRLCACTDHICS